MRNLLIPSIGKEIKYEEWVAKGIYLVSDAKVVKNNCKILNITIEEPAPLEVFRKVTHFTDYGIATIRLANDYYQYIISKKASEEDVNNMLKDAPELLKEVVLNAHSDFLSNRFSLD